MSIFSLDEQKRKQEEERRRKLSNSSLNRDNSRRSNSDNTNSVIETIIDITNVISSDTSCDTGGGSCD